MIFGAIGGRKGVISRLIGGALILWTIIVGKHAPALSGRGLVVLVATVPAMIAWLSWSCWSFGRRRLTPDVFVMAICGAVLQMASNSTAGSALTFIAAVTAAARAGVFAGLWVALSGALAVAVSGLVYNDGSLAVLAYSLGFAAAALGGSNIRQTRLRADQAELLLAQTQRSHEEQLRAAMLEDQAHLAREIHDVLAHSLAGLTIQLEATQALLDQGADVETIRARISRAHGLAREGLHETRRAVAALRGEATASAGEPVAAKLRQLAGDYSDGQGDPAGLTIGGDESLLAGSTGETIIRAVQEALTNVRKHAPKAPVQIEVQAGPDTVVVTVVNAVFAGVSKPLSDTGGGYGLRGMRERAEIHGGSVEAGAVDGGWKVQLTLPAKETQ